MGDKRTVITESDWELSCTLSEMLVLQAQLGESSAHVLLAVAARIVVMVSDVSRKPIVEVLDVLYASTTEMRSTDGP